MKTIARTIVLVSLFISGCESAQANRAAAPATQKEDRVERGAYLVKIMGCNDCHTPWKMGPDGPHPDMSRELSGHPQDAVMPPAPGATGPWLWHAAATNTAFAGPWGVSFTANLTPDKHSGLGGWNEEIFVQTIRNGRHMGVDRPLKPPMPWPMYRNATDEDLRSIWAYLQTIKPIRNQVPATIDPAR